MMQKLKAAVLSTPLFLLLLACVPAGADVLTPTGASYPEWTDEEKALPIATRKIEEDAESAHWFVRLTESEKPHTHDADLTVFVLSGKALLHYADRALPTVQGDVIRIPKGVEHWAEVTPGEVCEAYALYVKTAPKEEDHGQPEPAAS